MPIRIIVSFGSMRISIDFDDKPDFLTKKINDEPMNWSLTLKFHSESIPGESSFP